MEKKFRRCAGVIVFNKFGKVLLGGRIESKGNEWQFPQGGIEAGETPADAARRELFEETSVHSVELVAIDENPRRYEFSERVKRNFRNRKIFCEGQDIYFALFYFTGTDDEINVKTKEPEFKDYMWGDLDFAVNHIIQFKKDVYAAAAAKYKPIIEQYLKTAS